eukprot:gene21925-biopygen7673
MSVGTLLNASLVRGVPLTHGVVQAGDLGGEQGASLVAGVSLTVPHASSVSSTVVDGGVSVETLLHAPSSGGGVELTHGLISTHRTGAAVALVDDDSRAGLLAQVSGRVPHASQVSIAGSLVVVGERALSEALLRGSLPLTLAVRRALILGLRHLAHSHTSIALVAPLTKSLLGVTLGSHAVLRAGLLALVLLEHTVGPQVAVGLFELVAPHGALLLIRLELTHGGNLLALCTQNNITIL